MIGSCNCPIKGVQLQPTVWLQCLITTLQINLVRNRTVYAPIRFKEIVIVIIIIILIILITLFNERNTLQSWTEKSVKQLDNWY